MTTDMAIKEEMKRYLSACERKENRKAHVRLLALRRLQRGSLTVHEELKFRANV